ncbi:MAG: response regulator transcription factor [Anaerolineales bacterium]|nr:response regulator transcription factor [Anaerolineales bacterium]
MIRVLIVNEMLLLCDIISAALEDEDDIEVVGLTTAVEEALLAVSECDVLLVSISLPDQGALKLAEAVSEAHSEKKIIILGLTEHESQVLQYIEAGADGYVLKNHTTDDLVHIIRAIYNDRAPVSPQIAAAMMSRLSELSSTLAGFESAVNEDANLTDRETEILELVGQGLTNQEIADRLVIEIGTVKNHVHSILQKLEVSSRGEAAQYLAVIKN